MTPSEVYFDTRLDIDGFVALLRSVLNLPAENRTEYQREQRRESINYGGVYYLFEVLGFKLLLLQNLGETEIPERYDHSLYLVINGGADAANAALAEHIKEVVVREGIPAVSDSLSA
jgi:hypothetical protein